MAQLSQLEVSQKLIEVTIMEKMTHFEEKLKEACSSTTKCDSVDKLNLEFQSFKILVSSAFETMHQQIVQLQQSVDTIETFHRRKALIFHGIPEDINEDIYATVLNVIHDKLGLTNIDTNSLTQCHRLGKSGSKNRPVLIRFKNYYMKSEVWTNKTKLKGSLISLSEFLTKSRQLVFSNARKHFGVRQCWTQDGNILLKLPNNERRKVSNMQELNTLINKFPEKTNVPSTKSKYSSSNSNTDISTATCHPASKVTAPNPNVDKRKHTVPKRY